VGRVVSLPSFTVGHYPSMRVHVTERTDRFNDVEKSCSVTEWDMVLKRIPDYLESKNLKSSFRVWGQAIADQKLTSQTGEVMSRSDMGIGDHDFLIQSIKSRHADSEWIMAR
jgi:hypothetical protein